MHTEVDHSGDNPAMLVFITCWGFCHATHLPTPTGFGKLFAFSVNDKLLMWSPLTSPFTTFADGPTLQEERKWRQKQEERRRQEEEAHLSNVRILFFDHLTRLICRPWLKHIRTYICQREHSGSTCNNWQCYGHHGSSARKRKTAVRYLQCPWWGSVITSTQGTTIRLHPEQGFICSQY